MRKLLLLLSVVFAFVACSPVVGPAGRDGRDAPTDNAWVVNAAWYKIDSRAIDLEAPAATYPLEVIRDQYNGSRVDDFARIYVGSIPAIDKAPPVRLRVIETTLNRLRRDVTVTRAQYAETRRLVLAEMKPGEALYVDRDPPAPLPDPDPWAMYVINSRGKKQFEDRCVNWQQWPTREAYRYDRRIALQYTTQDHQNPAVDGEPWRFIEGYVYVEPEGAY
ncbi:MAG: hypothetical protein JNG85_00265 [Spirochaetaceae bacterium]|nr:hypothetical protein [Spirochaetaceae bacterium]